MVFALLTAVALIAGLSQRSSTADVVIPALALAGSGAGAVTLLHVQRSRALMIGDVISDRERLLGELLALEARERRQLAAQLHDGALQYVLAARIDLDDVREGTDPDALDRIDTALARSCTVLRDTVGELHPAVLEHAGLAAALRQVAADAAARGGLTISVHDNGWPDGTRTSVDPLLFAAARDLLAHVVCHAGARTVTVSVEIADRGACLMIRDDGVGIDPAQPDRHLGDGHPGVASHRVRIEAAGGTLALTRPPGGGTLSIVDLPIPNTTGLGHRGGDPAAVRAHDQPTCPADERWRQQ